MIDLSLQIEIRVEFGSMTVVVVEDDEVDALGEQLSRCVFWVFLLIYSTKVFSISKRIDENVSILILVKGCYFVYVSVFSSFCAIGKGNEKWIFSIKVIIDRFILP